MALGNRDWVAAYSCSLSELALTVKSSDGRFIGL
jgi:hypothetical protein